MSEYYLETPLTEEAVRKLKVKDKVYLSGRIIGMRDASLIRIFDQGYSPPVDLQGQVVLHTAPNVRWDGERYQPLSVGTTTSARMDRFTPGLLSLGVRALVGKGGLYREDSLKALREKGAVYLAIVGGAAAWQTSKVEAIEEVFWEDLIPEAVWVFRVNLLGPLFVAIDSHGANLYMDVMNLAKRRMEELWEI